LAKVKNWASKLEDETKEVDYKSEFLERKTIRVGKAHKSQVANNWKFIFGLVSPMMPKSQLMNPFKGYRRNQDAMLIYKPHSGGSKSLRHNKKLKK